MTDPRPLRIAVTTWRRRLPTVVARDQLLYTLGADYVQCLQRSGALSMLVPVVRGAEADDVLEGMDGLVVTGGDDVTPALYGSPNTGSRNTDVVSDHSDAALIAAARRRQLPTLGICRGMQILNVAFGGTLRQEVTGQEVPGRAAPHPLRPAAPIEALAYRHVVRLARDSWLAQAYGTRTRMVTSLHHQGVDELADLFVPVAHADDGLIEGIESVDPAWFAVGVQWHPEKMADEDMPLFERFVQRAQAQAGRHRRVGVG